MIKILSLNIFSKTTQYPFNLISFKTHLQIIIHQMYGVSGINYN